MVFILLLPSLAGAAVETTTITGKVVMPNGVVASAGNITATLSAPGSTTDLATSQKWQVGGRFTGTIAVDGTVTGLVLVPNDAITPAGTYYTVVINVTAPTRDARTFLWSVTTAPDPVTIGAITRLDQPPSLTEILDNNSDVTYTGSLADEQCLVVDVPGNIWTNKTCPVGAIALDALTDVTLTTPAIGSVLVKSAGDWLDGQVDLADPDAVTGVLPDANVADTLTASNYLPLAGGTMTGLETVRDSGPSLTLPKSASFSVKDSAIRFNSRSGFTSGPWTIANSDLVTGSGSEDHTLQFCYNCEPGISVSPGSSSTLDRITSGEHALRWGFESGFCGGGCDPLTKSGLVEFNLDVDRDTTGAVVTDARPYFFTYDMDNRKSRISVGDLADPNSIYFEMSGLPLRGTADFAFGSRDAPALFWKVTAGSPGSLGLVGSLILSPNTGYNNTTASGVISMEGSHLNIAPGRVAEGGALGDLYFGLYRNFDSIFGNTASNSAHVSIDGVADEVQLSLQGHSTQTTPLVTVETSAGTDIITVHNSGVVRFEPLISPPASCVQGDVYVDTSGAFCVCVTAGTPGTWNNAVATGTCA